MHNATGLSGSFGPMHEINETDQINEIDQLRSARPASLARLSSGSVPLLLWPHVRTIGVLAYQHRFPAGPGYAGAETVAPLTRQTPARRNRPFLARIIHDVSAASADTRL